MKIRCLLGLISVCGALGASAQVRIHDPVVRLLAKPYGIEKRIKLRSIDGVDFGPGGTARLAVTLENSGVKEVTLKNPVFEFACRGADGKWIVLGQLDAMDIVFPVTAGDRWVRRRYVLGLKPAVAGKEFVRRLREAAADGARVRLLGRARMVVKQDGKKNFERANLKLELGGVAVLGKGFKPVWHRHEKNLPKRGLVK